LVVDPAFCRTQRDYRTGCEHDLPESAKQIGQSDDVCLRKASVRSRGSGSRVVMLGTLGRTQGCVRCPRLQNTDPVAGDADGMTATRETPTARGGLPTVLALLGVVSAGTAFVRANDLYDGYAWWFRFGGLMALALGIAVGTYLRLYVVTTWLGAFA
jgi:hypothetical protein